MAQTQKPAKALSQLAKLYTEYWKSTASLDSLLSKGRFTSLEPGKVIYEVEIEERHCNSNGMLHGGFTAMMVDTITSAAILSKVTLREEKPLYSGVSVALNVNYLKGIKLGEPLRVVARVDKMGKTLAFTSCEVLSKVDEQLIATGQHTKFVA